MASSLVLRAAPQGRSCLRAFALAFACTAPHGSSALTSFRSLFICHRPREGPGDFPTSIATLPPGVLCQPGLSPSIHDFSSCSLFHHHIDSGTVLTGSISIGLCSLIPWLLNSLASHFFFFLFLFTDTHCLTFDIYNHQKFICCQDLYINLQTLPLPTHLAYLF